MRCAEALHLMDAVLDGRADERHEQLLRFHINGCPQCRRAMLENRAISSGVRSLEEPSPPKDLMEGILSRLESGSYDKSPIRTGHGPLRWRFAAVIPFAAAAVLILGSRYGSSGQVPFPEEDTPVSAESGEPATQYAPAEVIAYSRPSSVTTF